MHVYTELTLFAAGLVCLLYGANRVVAAGSKLALYYGVSTFFIGVSVVSIGTSIPEITTSIFSALYGAGDIVVGNIVGSETAQITLAIGIVAIIAPIVAKRRNIMVYGGGMILAMIIMILTLEDGRITRLEGLLMMLSYVFFVYHMYTTEGGEEVVEEEVDNEQKKPTKTIPWILLGVGLVTVGGHLMVQNGIILAQQLQIPEYFIGLLTGLGTTLPEIAVAGIAAWRKNQGISAGSILGSNITDPVFSLGAGALVAEIAVSNMHTVMLSAGYMLAVSLFVVSLFYWREGLGKKEGILCMLLYLPSLLLL